MTDKEWTLPAYLSNLNDDSLDDILFDGKDYLQGLPLRRHTSKRKRPSDDDDFVSIGQPSKSLFHRITKYTTLSQYRFYDICSRDGAVLFSVVIISTSALLVYGFIIKRRRSEIKEENTPRKKKRKRKRKKMKSKTIDGLSEYIQTADSNGLGSGTKERPCITNINEDQLTEVAIVTPPRHKVERTICQESEVITTNSLRDELCIDMYQEVSLTTTQASNQNAMDIIHSRQNQLNSQASFPINKIASRWESLGLSRQKSLELAASAEMNWYLYQEMKQFVSSTANHLFVQLGWHSLQFLSQSETHHRERMNAPAFDMLRKCRQEAKFSLLRTQLLCQCLFLALAARLVRHDNLGSLSAAAVSTFLSNLCPDCNTPIIQDTFSNFLYYDLDSWRNFAYNLMGSMSSAWYCIGRLIFCTFCLGILHCVSRKLTYALLASTLVPWRDIMFTGVVLVATNCLLTCSMLQRCSNFDVVLKKTGVDVEEIDPRQVTDLYKRQMNIYRAVSYFASICIGLFGIGTYI